MSTTKYDLAKRLVDREIYYCVSELVSTMGELLCQGNSGNSGLSWENDILPLCEHNDYETPAIEVINDCDDFYDLENMAESVGYWSDAIAATGYDATLEYADEDGYMYSVSFDEWFEDHRTDAEKADVLTALHQYIINAVSNWQEFCEDNDIEADHYEVYEHWLISNWLSEKLAAKGETVGELCGLTIWGRGCTGQAIALDGVIERIACELWGDELTKGEVA